MLVFCVVWIFFRIRNSRGFVSLLSKDTTHKFDFGPARSERTTATEPTEKRDIKKDFRKEKKIVNNMLNISIKCAII